MGMRQKSGTLVISWWYIDSDSTFAGIMVIAMISIGYISQVEAQTMAGDGKAREHSTTTYQPNTLRASAAKWDPNRPFFSARGAVGVSYPYTIRCKGKCSLRDMQGSSGGQTRVWLARLIRLKPMRTAKREGVSLRGAFLSSSSKLRWRMQPCGFVESD